MKTVILNERSPSPEHAKGSEESLKLWYAVAIRILHAKNKLCVAKGFTLSKYDNFMWISKLAHGVSYIIFGILLLNL